MVLPSRLESRSQIVSLVKKVLKKDANQSSRMKIGRKRTSTGVKKKPIDLAMGFGRSVPADLDLWA